MTHLLWKTCEECGIRTRHIHLYKGTYLCHQCYLQCPTIIKISAGYPMSMEKAINRIYTIKTIVGKNGQRISGALSFPKILAGKRIKIILIDEVNK